MNTIKFQFESIGEGDSFIPSNEGERYTIPIGGLVVCEVVIKMNGEPARVLSSRWQVAGQQIVGNSIVQTLQRGAGNLQTNPIIPGGYGGNPAYIGTAWVDVGDKQIIITGQCESRGKVASYTVHGLATIVSPVFSIDGITTGIVNPHIEEHSLANLLTTQWSTNSIPYICPHVSLFGGDIGFLQTVRGYRYRGIDRHPRQIKGFNNLEVGYIDCDNANHLFYDQQTARADGIISTSDQPSEILAYHHGQTMFNWYRVGAMNGDRLDTEKFETYLAYKAPIPQGGQVIESYIVVKNVTTWAWAAEAKFTPGEGGWGVEHKYSITRCLEKWELTNWKLPLWESSTASANVWRDIGPHSAE